MKHFTCNTSWIKRNAGGFLLMVTEFGYSGIHHFYSIAGIFRINMKEYADF